MQPETFNAILARHELNRTRLAELLSLNKSSLTRWFTKRAPNVPAERAVEIERLTGIPRHELRPDLFPPPSEAA